MIILPRTGEQKRFFACFRKCFRTPRHLFSFTTPSGQIRHFSTKVFGIVYSAVPWGIKHYQWYLPFMPTATESFNLDGFDVVLSSSSMFAKGVITQPETLHISYCHTPTRYLWSDSHRYLSELHIPKILKKMTPFLLTQIRMWDYLAAARADHMVANSSIVRERIQKYYGREASSSRRRWMWSSLRSAHRPGIIFWLAGGLWRTSGWILSLKRLIGFAVRSKFSATDRSENTSRRARESTSRLLAKFPTRNCARCTKVRLRLSIRRKRTLGITPIESMAAGRPVIAYGRGGAIETIVSGKTGVFVDEQSWEALADAIVRFKPARVGSCGHSRARGAIQRQGVQRKMMAYITTAWEAWKSSRVTKSSSYVNVSYETS